MQNDHIEIGKINFEAFHKPAIISGRFTFEPYLSLSGGITDTFYTNLTIEIAGPRFQLSPKDIHAVFPPRDSLGEFDNVLPHIELGSGTLPWKRSSGKENTPWLGLILLQEEEANDKKVVQLIEKEWTVLRDALELGEEILDNPENDKKPFPPIKALYLNPDFFDQVIPSAEELKWLSHVRIAHNVNEEIVERAVLVCNRMPQAGRRAVLHLVSFENRFDSNGVFNKTKGINENGMIPFLSLHSWEFSCPNNEEFKVSDQAIARMPTDVQEILNRVYPQKEDKEILYRGKEAFIDGLKKQGLSQTEIESNKIDLLTHCHIQTETFKGLMDNLDRGWMKLDQTSTNETVHFFLSQGSVPLAHVLRTGEKVPSWYRGPLIANRVGPIAKAQRTSLLPVRNSDKLLLFNEASNMLDVSYAAAWELGRLLTISQPNISQKIVHWKTSHAREAALVEQQLVFSHIPFTDAEFAHKEEGNLNQGLKDYFTDLSLLKNIPFQYLVPHEDLLPHESLRFFYIDPLWVESLLDGAFSIGRTTELDTQRDDDQKAPPKEDRPQMTGIMLRSDLVSGWPSLIVDGFNSNDELLKNSRFERLGSNVLIVLFEGIINKLEIHLPAESWHFGFNRPHDEKPEYFKELKDDDGHEIRPNIEANIHWKNDNKAMRVFSPTDFVDAVSTNGITINHSGLLALQLLEGAPKLVIQLT